MSGARGVCRPGSHCAVRRSNRDGSHCAELCVLEARPPGTWGCGHLWGLKEGCGWLRVESGLRERSWARTQELGASGCCQVRVTATSVGESEPFGALIFLFQLAGQTCIPVNRWAGYGCGGAGRGCSRARFTNHRCLGGAEARDVRAGRRPSGSAPSPACARTCLLHPTPRWLSRGETQWNLLTFPRGCDAGSRQAVCSPASVRKVGKNLPEALLVGCELAGEWCRENPTVGDCPGAGLLRPEHEEGLCADELQIQKSAICSHTQASDILGLRASQVPLECARPGMLFSKHLRDSDEYLGAAKSCSAKGPFDEKGEP